MYTVAIVEPHPLFRLGLRQLLSDALSLTSVEDHDYSSLDELPDTTSGKCDLLLLSLCSSRPSDDLAQAAVRRFSPVRILLMAEAGNLQDPDLALPSCVAGSVAKDAPPEIVQASVRLILAGGNCFPSRSISATQATIQATTPLSSSCHDNPNPSRYAPASWASGLSGGQNYAALAAANPHGYGDAPDPEFAAPIKPGSAAHKESQLLGLTPRQYEVLVLLARGYPMKTVGRALNISVATAKAHTETLYQRLDVHNRNAAVYAAVSRGATLGWAHMLSGQTAETTS